MQGKRFEFGCVVGSIGESYISALTNLAKFIYAPNHLSISRFCHNNIPSVTNFTNCKLMILKSFPQLFILVCKWFLSWWQNVHTNHFYRLKSRLTFSHGHQWTISLKQGFCFYNFFGGKYHEVPPHLKGGIKSCSSSTWPRRQSASNGSKLFSYFSYANFLGFSWAECETFWVACVSNYTHILRKFGILRLIQFGTQIFL